MRTPVLIAAFLIGNTGMKIREILYHIVEDSTSELSPKCNEQFQQYFANLSFNDYSWASQMLDASSKIPSGLLSYNFGEMGNFEQCINIKTSVDNGTILGKYCLGALSVNSPAKQNDEWLRQKAGSFGDLGNLADIAESTGAPGASWAMCVPDGCTSQDVTVIGNHFFAFVTGSELKVNFSDMLCQTAREVHRNFTVGAILTISILALLLFVVVTCTAYDVYCTRFAEKPCHWAVKAFSMYFNCKKLFKTTEIAPDHLPCLSGLKFISMMWVVSGHQYSVSLAGPITNSKDLMSWADSLYSMFLVNGTLSVDTFFTIGGVLMVYIYMKVKKKHPINLFTYVLHRYLRLTPAFAVVVLISSTLLVYMGSGPKWPYVEVYFQENCVNYWWSALIYFQNYINVDRMCVGQTWYLCIDMQLYIFSYPVLCSLMKWPKRSLTFLTILIVVVMSGTFYIAWANKLTALLSNFYGNTTEYHNKYYLLTHTRAVPWIVGVILGYYIFKIKQGELSLRLNKIIVVVIWAITLAVLLICVLGGHSTLRGKEYDRFGNSFHITAVRPAWSLAISWIILACTTNYGGPINWILSLPIFQVLNRLTYCIYLTHVTMLYLIIYNKKWPDYFSNFNLVYQFWGTFCFSIALSVFLCIMTESPMIVLSEQLANKLKECTILTPCNERLTVCRRRLIERCRRMIASIRRRAVEDPERGNDNNS